MRNHRSALAGALISVLLVVPAFATVGHPDNLSDEGLHQTGWTIDKLQFEGAGIRGVRRLTATGRFNLPAKSVWQAIAYDNKSDWPSVSETVVESHIGDTVIARYKISVPIVRDRRYRLRIVNDDARMEEVFRQVPGYGNVRAINGFWKLTPISDSVTRADYLLDTDPGVRLVPGFIIDWATKRVVPGVYEQVYKIASRNVINPDLTRSR